MGHGRYCFDVSLTVKSLIGDLHRQPEGRFTPNAENQAQKYEHGHWSQHQLLPGSALQDSGRNPARTAVIPPE